MYYRKIKQKETLTIWVRDNSNSVWRGSRDNIGVKSHLSVLYIGEQLAIDEFPKLCMLVCNHCVISKSWFYSPWVCNKLSLWLPVLAVQLWLLFYMLACIKFSGRCILCLMLARRSATVLMAHTNQSYLWFTLDIDRNLYWHLNAFLNLNMHRYLYGHSHLLPYWYFFNNLSIYRHRNLYWSVYHLPDTYEENHNMKQG